VKAWPHSCLFLGGRVSYREKWSLTSTETLALSFGLSGGGHGGGASLKMGPENTVLFRSAPISGLYLIVFVSVEKNENGI
jgi:hypothetical protein